MPKPSKKKGKNDPPKEEPTQSSVSYEEPSTSAPPQDAEDDDVGLTGASRKRKEKKEKKEKALQALQALQASRKPSSVSESASKSESEPPSEQQSRAQSAAPSEPAAKEQSPSDVPPEKPVEPIKTKAELKADEEDDVGIGITGASRKKKPRKKKVDTPPAASQQVSSPQEVQAVTSDVATLSISSTSTQPTSPIPAPLPLPTQPTTAAAPGPWSKGPSAGRGRGWATTAPAGPAPVGSAPVLCPTTQTPIRELQPPQLTRPQQSVAQRLPLATPTPVAKPSSTSNIQLIEPYSTNRPPKSLEPVLCRYKIPTKIPGGVVNARHIRVLVNYLEMQFKALKISRYDVSFTPDRPKKMLPEVFAIVKNKFFPKDLIAFDQMKNCYSLKPLKNVTSTGRFTTTVEIKDQNARTMTFEVSMKSTGVVDLENIKRYMATRGSSLCHPTEEIQCIDVILRQGALESYVKAGRQFFKRPLNPVSLGYGYEMWTGLFQSAIFTSKAFINIDVAHKGFPKHQTLVDALIKDFRLDPSRPVDNQRGGDYFTAFVKGLKVVATLVGDSPSAGHRREFVCNALVGPPHELTFTLNDEDRTRTITVSEYFAKVKKYRLQYPNLNCLWVGARDRQIYFPIELLTVAEGQPLARQLNDQQVSVMVREAATPPDVRLKKITETIYNMKYSQNKDFKQFGLDIADKFYTVKAKVLEPPVLDIGNGKVKPRNGQWQAQRLLKPEQLQTWALFGVDCDPRIDYDNIIQLIIGTGAQMGMSIAAPKIVNGFAKMQMMRSILMNAQKDVRFVFLIISARGRDDYHKLKQIAERDVGILTQCIKEATAKRMNVMTAKNILLKVNSKLMGINQAIDTVTTPRCLKEGGVMIVGADVTHPSPDQSNVPSIAAVTASMDGKCYIYNIELSIQTPKKEVIVEFEDMMFDHLKVYKSRNNNQLPRKIFVFRDGVSEGQFAQVMNSELAAVHLAYQRLAGQNKKPEVLFLLVQKRHHTRLFNEGPNSRYNVEPGTVVDTDIVHASELDFYLVSHQAIKGTARPTRYHAVCNDGKIPDDEVEQLTYYLCHLYSRCMRSVSYPTPTYYAHLACLRARSLTHGERFDNRELEKKPKRLHVLDKMLEFSRMFFV